VSIAQRDLVITRLEPGGLCSVKLTNAHETNHKKERVSIVRTCHLFTRALFNSESEKPRWKAPGL